MTFARLLEGLPVEPLAALLDAHPDWWKQITMRQDYLGSAHHETECIYLRGPRSFDFEHYFGESWAGDFPRLRDTLTHLMPVMRPLLDAIGWQELGRVMLVRMPAGAQLEEHTDEGPYAEHYSRYHVPIVTNAHCEMWVDGETQHMAAGDAWWFNHRVPHTAYNNGDAARIHLIVDAVPRDYRLDTDGPCNPGPVEPHDGREAGAA